MATIRARQTKDGRTTYNVQIRMKGYECQKTFFNEEDANLYVLYRERLITNMKNFEVFPKDTITLEQIFELKRNSISEIDRRFRNELDCSLKRFKILFKDKMFYHEISVVDWENAAKDFMNFDVKKGGGTGNTIKPSLSTLRKLFANASSCISYAISQGIDIPNNALIVMQSYINPLIEKKKVAVFLAENNHLV